MARINMDVDGVVADFVGGLFDAMRLRGHVVAPVSDPMWQCWDIFSVMDKNARDCAFEVMTGGMFWEGLPVLPGAVDGISAIRDAGHHIQWVTTGWPPREGYEGCKMWWSARMAWLHQHFDESVQDLANHLTVTGSKTEVFADAFIDDKASAVFAWAKAWPESKAYLFENNHNAEHHRIGRGMSWDRQDLKNFLEDLK